MEQGYDIFKGFTKKREKKHNSYLNNIRDKSKILHHFKAHFFNSFVRRKNCYYKPCIILL